MQEAEELKEPVPPLTVQLTVPVGVVGEEEVSVTVAVHVEVDPRPTEPGVQLTLVVVEAVPTASGKLPELVP